MRGFVRPLLVLAMLLGCSEGGGTPDATTDKRAQARALAVDGIACTSSADCCAVADTCMNELLLVPVAQRDQAARLLTEAPREGCLRCEMPGVQVDCEAGRCVALRLVVGDGGAAGPAPEAFTVTHCGAMALPPGWTTMRPGMAKTIIGCGP